MRRIAGGGKLFILGAAVLMAGLVIATLLAMNALLGHALSPSLNANAPDSATSARPAPAPNLQVITPAAIAPTPASPILVYQAPTPAQPILIFSGTDSGSSGSSRSGGTVATKTEHTTTPASAAVKAPAPTSGTSVSTSGAPTTVATSASGSTIAGGVAPETLPLVPVVGTAPGVTSPTPSPTPPGSTTAAAAPNTNQSTTNTNADWLLHHHH